MAHGDVSRDVTAAAVTRAADRTLVRAPATAKINLALVVGPTREDACHELVTVLQRVDVADRISLEPAAWLTVTGFPQDTLVRAALERLAELAGAEPCWHVHIEKHIPVAAGLAGGSSDAATALRLANGLLGDPLDPEGLHSLAASLGADVPFFLTDGPQLATGTGSELARLALPSDYWVVLVVPDGASKRSTAAVYEEFDRRGGPERFAERRAALDEALARVRRPRDLAALPANDLASSPLAEELR
ncbi:MAG: hypothetical protein M3229_03360, partial [Actinomycetota bacterium]|nr:hypothetical protein [Actinomycetota bacterium]